MTIKSHHRECVLIEFDDNGQPCFVFKEVVGVYIMCMTLFRMSRSWKVEVIQINIVFIHKEYCGKLKGPIF